MKPIRYQWICCVIMFVVAFGYLNGQTRLKRFEAIPKATPVTSLQVDHPDCAVLIVQSAIPNLLFESNMGKIKAQEYRHLESRYIVFLYPEKQKVSVKCPGFVEAEFPMFSELKPRQQFSYEINEAYDTTEKGDFTLQSDPPGADITIEQFPSFKEKTPFVFKGYGAMTYTIRLQKSRYEQFSANIQIEPDKAKSQTFKLVPKWADLIISSEPTGSTVFINNVQKGTTPLSLTGVTNGLDPGDYNLEIRPASQFYESYSQKLSLLANKQEEIKHKHMDISGYLRVNASPQPLEVLLNGNLNYDLAMGERVRLINGSYKVEIKNMGENRQYYQPYSESFNLKAQDDKLISLILEDNSGTVNVSPSHLPVQLYLNNQIDSELTMKHSKRLIASTYSLKAVYTGEHRSAFEPIEQSIQLKARDNLNLPLAFQPRMHSLNLTANVPDYTINILDKETGKSTAYTDPSQIPPLYAGTYTIRVVKPGYRIVSQELNIADKDIALEIMLEELGKIYFRKIGQWKASKYTSATTLLVSLGATAYFGYNSLQNYDNYQKATTSSAAADYRSKAIDSRNIAYSTMGIDVLGGSWMLYSYLKQKHWQKKLQTDMGMKQ